MLVIQFTGLSGAGKTTLARRVKDQLQDFGLPVEIIDGDQYRKTLCSDLGFSKEDRCENIRRLGKVAYEFSKKCTISIIAAINPYEEMRQELAVNYQAKTVYIHCDLQTLLGRDTKGLYKQALLPDEHPEKLHHLTGVNDPYEVPPDPDLTVYTSAESEEESARKIYSFILAHIEKKALV